MSEIDPYIGLSEARKIIEKVGTTGIDEMIPEGQKSKQRERFINWLKRWVKSISDTQEEVAKSNHQPGEAGADKLRESGGEKP